MHLVHVVEAFGAGTLQALVDLSGQLHSSGHRLTIFHGVRPETPADFVDLFPTGVVFHRLSTGRAISVARDFTDTVGLCRFIRANDVDLIHGHSSKGGALARLAGLATGIPVFYTPHGYPFVTQNGPGRRKASFWLERAIGFAPALTVCCSDSEASVARLLTRNVSVVPNSVDLGRVDKIVGARSRDVVGVGRICEQKNVPLFLEVARRLPHRSFVWVGGPGKEIEGPVPENVEVTGWLPQANGLAIMAGARVYLSTSRREGMPITLLEAMALGKPAVCTDVTGNRDLVDRGVTGHLASTAHDLAESVEALLVDRARADALGRAARRLIETNHTPAVVGRRWQTLYTEWAERGSKI
jgi:glycosyltransferase involved in cell wall biosynthesis